MLFKSWVYQIIIFIFPLTLVHRHILLQNKQSTVCGSAGCTGRLSSVQDAQIWTPSYWKRACFNQVHVNVFIMVSLVPTYSYISIRSLGEREDALNTHMSSESACLNDFWRILWHWSNDAEISVLHHRNKLHFITYSSKKYFTILVFYGIFDQTNAASVSIIDKQII